MTINGVSIDYSSNSVKGTTARGGAIYAGQAVSVTASSKITLASNSADAQGTLYGARGGAVWAGSGVTFDTNEFVARDNFVKDTKIAYGGVAYTNAGVSHKGTSVDYSNNSVKAEDARGGAIYADTLALTNTKRFALSSNSADATSSAQGGALWLGSDATVTADVFAASDNLANAAQTAQGGVVYSASDLTLEGESADFTDNSARAAGNRAKAYGGAIYAEGDATLTVTALMLSGNSADARGANSVALGGAVYVEGAVALEGGTLTLTGNTALASGDSSGAAQGGAIYASSGAVELSGGNVELSTNVARSLGGTRYAQGGVIYAEDGDITISGSSIALTANSADSVHTSQGGALYAENGSIVLSSTGNLSIENNLARSQGNSLTAAGGAIYAYWNEIELTGTETIKVTGNQAQVSGDGVSATGGAVHGEDAVTMTGGAVTLTDNIATASGDNTEAHGGVVYAPWGDVEITGTSITVQNNHATAKGAGSNATGGAIHGEYPVTLTGSGAVMISGNYAAVEGDDSSAQGGVMYVVEDAAISGTSITVQNNSASASGANSTAWGGAFLVGGNLEISAVDTILFSGNYSESDTLSRNASLGGAVYALGDAVMTASSLNFTTSTDDVFARGNITVTGRLTAVPGTSFTAGGQFAMGADGASSLTLTVQPFTDVAAERSPGDLTIFGGAADTANGAENAIDFKRASLILGGASDLTVRNGRVYADVAAVLYKKDPGLIDGGSSADITEKSWAMDVSAYRNGSLYIHNAITQTDEQTQAAQEALGLGYTAKLVLAYDRRALIWRAQNVPWNEAVAANTAWVQASDDIFTPWVEDSAYVADSFWRGDIVVFDGKVYDELTPGSEKPATCVIEVPIDAAGVAPAQVYVTGGQNRFTGGALSAGKLFVRGADTSANFAVPVNAADLVSVDQAAVTFAELAAQVNTPVEIGGTVTVTDAANGVYTIADGGTLTLAGGEGTLTGLTLEKGAVLNVNSLGAYSVSKNLTVAGGASTLFDFGGDWAPGDGFGIGGSSTAEAKVSGAAALTINGIAEGATGTWKLLDKFASVTVDGTAWAYSYGSSGSTLKINTSDGSARGDLADYIVTTKTADGAYVLSITRPEGDLIWNGEKETWSATGAGRAWLIAGDDPDVPFAYEGRTFTDEFANGAVVTFNKLGAAQQSVTVSGDVVTPALRVTAGAYSFAGSGAIEAHSLLIDDSIFGTGTSVSFDVPVNVSENLESGAGTTAWLTELNMGEETPANVSGRLELANAAGGVFTVSDGGTLTLAGGEGSLAGLTLADGAALNVNAPGAYSVT